MSIRSTQLVHSLILHTQDTKEPPAPSVPPTFTTPANANPSPLVHFAIQEVDIGEKDPGKVEHADLFESLTPLAVCSAAAVVAGLPITVLTLDMTHTLVISADPWMALFAELPSLAALHISGFMDRMCPLLTRLRVGGPHAVITAEDETFSTLEEMLEWRAARGAARIEELEVGFVHEEFQSPKDLARAQAKYGPRIARLVDRATFDHASAGRGHGRDWVDPLDMPGIVVAELGKATVTNPSPKNTYFWVGARAKALSSSCSITLGRRATGSNPSSAHTPGSLAAQRLVLSELREDRGPAPDEERRPMTDKHRRFPSIPVL
ncbi:uncharacterized protein BXZ73DRAFT_82067 [Epithele typhae]|uniref:uncharacterized protein n=1 Tax=Epithele typhae TaxID=378194 RepID=UPI002008AAC8|nr:uncharacterized protein BXZ73DRAFT_82067 [Epithele typhae]KAH9912977.1 hypothetical protein BXZ73DRAFT_82067 [Epithele typhae]